MGEMIEKILTVLRARGDVRSSADFSREWLGREESYVRSLRAKARPASAQVLATCASRLLERGDALSGSQYGSVKKHGMELQQLAQECIQTLILEARR